MSPLEKDCVLVHGKFENEGRRGGSIENEREGGGSVENEGEGGAGYTVVVNLLTRSTCKMRQLTD